MRKVFGKGLMQKIEPVFFDFVKLSTFVQEESGQDLIEYALVAGLIGIGAVTAMTNLGGKISRVFNAIGTNLAGT